MQKITYLAVCFSFLVAVHLQATEICPPIALRGHIGEVRFAAFSPAGCRAVTVDDDTVRVWSTITGRLVRIWKWCADADPAEVIGTGKRFVTLEGNTVCIWNSKTGRLVRVLQWCPAMDDIVFAAPSPNGHKIVTVRTDNSVQVSKARTGRPLRGLFGREDTDPIDRAAVSSLGHKVITVSGDTVLIWKLP